MANERKAFMFYLDWLDAFAQLSDEEAGRLLRVIGKYVKTGEDETVALDRTLQMLFSLMRGQLDRDKEKYEKRCEASRENGKKGGRPPKQQPPADEPTSDNERFQQILDIQAAYKRGEITVEEYEAAARAWAG